MKDDKNKSGKGFYVLTWGGGRYTSVSWHATQEEADREVARIKLACAWHGLPPKTEKVEEPS